MTFARTLRTFGGALLHAVALGSAAHAADPLLSLTARLTNPLAVARPEQMVEIRRDALPERVRSVDLAAVLVVDAATGTRVLSQGVDEDGDGTADVLVFLASFGPSESKAFTLRPGERPPYVRADFRVRGRFVRERFDDFAWENDRVAHRMYGPALETWQKEPLTSSTVDVWCKKTRRLVQDDWYLVDDYHRDHGEGADFYSAGKSRGCGGSGVLVNGALATSRNFRESRVLANGPLRLVFELTYAPWDAGGVRVSERKRVSLDAGSHLNRFESFYTVEGGAPAVAWAAGIKKAAGSSVNADLAAGTLRTWEPIKDGNGNLACGLVADPAALASTLEADGNVLVAGKPAAVARYWAGSAWDRAGDIPTRDAWDRHLAEAARRLANPVKIDVRLEP